MENTVDVTNINELETWALGQLITLSDPIPQLETGSAVQACREILDYCRNVRWDQREQEFDEENKGHVAKAELSD